MNIVLGFSIIGISACVFLGTLFYSKAKDSLISNRFLGAFFLLFAIRLGKLLAQEYLQGIALDIYFNLMHAAFFAIGPVIWFYVRTYLSQTVPESKVAHFLPSIFFLIGAFLIRQTGGESVWISLYWMIQIHPLLYVYLSTRFLMEDSRSRISTSNQKAWLYSLLGIVTLLPIMNILYLTLDFPFYLVTALLVIVALYLICFLALNNKTNVLIGKGDQKYKNIKLASEEIKQLKVRIHTVLIEQKLYLNDQLRLSDVSKKLGVPPHLISRVINENGGKSFPQFINELRINRAKEKLIADEGKKVVTIAFESGFRSLSAFNRAFKNYSGINPSEYRIKYSTKTSPDLEKR